MPASFTVDLARRMVFSRGWGVLVDADLRQTRRGVRATPGFEPDFRQLYDFSEVTEVGLTTDGLQDIARHSPFGRNARRAVVVNSEVAFGMVRMYQILSGRENWHFRIFRDRESALEWLEDTSTSTSRVTP
jgi:hypothetical protein